MPVISVAFAAKWYCLTLIREGSATPLTFEEVEQTIAREWDWAEDGSVVGDHIIHPKAVRMYAAKMNYHLDELAYELLIGRWVLECPGCAWFAEKMGNNIEGEAL